MTAGKGLQEITEATVIKWLTEAKAAQPWDPANIAFAARNLEGQRLQVPDMEQRYRAHTKLDRAQKAIDELRRALKALLRSASDDWDHMVRLGIAAGPAADNYRVSMAKTDAMLKALVNFDEPPKQKPMVELARDAYSYFRLIVPNAVANRDPDNPAILFVQAALRAHSLKTVASAALETILTRRTTVADRYEQAAGIAVTRFP